MLHGMSKRAGHHGHGGHPAHTLKLADRSEMRNWADRMSEDDPLPVPFALSLGLDAIVAPRLLFTALDASLTAGYTNLSVMEQARSKEGETMIQLTQTTSLCPFPRAFGLLSSIFGGLLLCRLRRAVHAL